VPIFVYGVYPAVEEEGIWVAAGTGVGWFSAFVFGLIFGA
jgi:hypothetical protein